MLDELTAQAEAGFAAEDIPGVIRSLMSIGDKLWIEADDEFMGVDNPSRIVWLIGALLQRVPEGDRCELLETSVREAEAVGTPALLVRRLVRTFGVPTESSIQETPEEQLDTREALISIGCAQQLEQVAAERIASASQQGEIWDVERPLWLMGEWRRWGDPAAVGTWFQTVLADDDRLARCLTSIGRQRVTTKGLRYRLDPRWFDDYAARGVVAEAVRRLRAVISEGDAAEASDQYLLELKMLEDGKDPEVRFDWD